MDPLDALTDSNPKAPATDTAPAAAAWLRNPDSAPVQHESCAQRLMRDLEENGEWTGPDDDPEEDTTA